MKFSLGAGDDLSPREGVCLPTAERPLYQNMQSLRWFVEETSVSENATPGVVRYLARTMVGSSARFHHEC